MTTSLQESKKSGKLKVISIAVIAFFMLPIITTAILYFTNENFKYMANDFLDFLPGGLGTYFESQPTREEREELKNQIAEHYITLEEDRIVDKLLLVKSEDIRLYNDLLVQLNRLNAKKMSRVKNEIRNKEIDGDILFQLASDISLENNEKIDSLVRYYSSLNLRAAVVEIESSYERNEIDSEELALVFERLPIDLSARLLTLMDRDISDRIRYSLPIHTRRDIDKKINENIYRENELLRLANIFEEKEVDELFDEIGNEEKFNIEELAVIYSHMSYIKSGKILANINDQEFIFNLYNHIDRYEDLNEIEEGRTVTLAKAVQTIKDYDSKVTELANIYQRMARPELGRIIEQMMRSNEVVITNDLGNSESITFTQEQLIIDVLKQFRPNIITEIMEQLDTRRATELSKKLVQ